MSERIVVNAVNAANAASAARLASSNTARWLTFAGIIPFVALLALMFVTDYWQNAAQRGLYLQLLTTYAAVILSFLGGIQWGIGLSIADCAPRSAQTLFYLSVVPSLLAWTMLMIAHPTSRIVAAIFIFGFVWVIDTLLNLQKLIPAWFYKLRTIITGSVISVLVVVAIKI